MESMSLSRSTAAFNFYIDTQERRDVVSVTLPELDLQPEKPQLTGLALTVYFASIDCAVKALENRSWQLLEVRLAEESYNLLEGQVECCALRHTAFVRPKRLGIGSVRAGESSLPFVQYEVSSYKTVREGDIVLEIDTAAQICTVGSRDFSKEVFRKK